MPAGALAEVAHEVVVHQEALDQRPQVRVGQLQQHAAQPLEQFVDVLRRVRQEVAEVEADLLRLHALDVVEDDLHRPLEELHLAADLQEVADVERLEDRLAGVPLAGVDGAGAVGEIDLEIEVAVAVGPQLLVGHQEDFVDRLAVGQLLDETPGH